MNRLTRFAVFFWRHLQPHITDETRAGMWAWSIIIGFGIVGMIIGAFIELSPRAIIGGAFIGGYLVPLAIYVVCAAWDKANNSLLVHTIRSAWQDANTKDKHQ